MPQLTPDQKRARVAYLYQNGQTDRNVLARHVGVARSTIDGYLKNLSPPRIKVDQQTDTSGSRQSSKSAQAAPIR